MDSDSNRIDLNIIKNQNKYSKIFEYSQNKYAMVYIPKKPNLPLTGLLLFNAGHRYRTGPNDLYVKIGIELSKRGLYVITPDPDGMGDSFEKFEFKHTQEHQNKIQKGVYVKDGIESIKYFKNKLSLSKIYVSGLCGGTRTALSCINKLDYIDGIIAWCCPFQLSDNLRVGYNERKIAQLNINGNKEEKKRKSKNANELKRKIKKIYSLKIDWKYHYNRFLRNIYRIAKKDKSFDYKAVKLLKKIIKKDKKIIFVYSENDFHYDIYRDYFLPWYGNEYKLDKITTTLHETNHVVGNEKSLNLLTNLMFEFCCNEN